jgi:hypothetical protein
MKFVVVCAILLTRAAVETTAALWYLIAKIDASVATDTKAEINEALTRLLMRHKNEPARPPAINVMTFVDRVEKGVPGFRQQTIY